MVKLIIRVVINMIALWAAAYFVGGVTLTDDLVQWIVIAVVFGLVNAFIKPIIKLLTLPLNIITLGLFTFVVNALMLLLTAWIVPGLIIEGGFVERFITALLGSIVISIVSTILNWILTDD